MTQFHTEHADEAVEERIRAAMEHAAPSQLDRILAECTVTASQQPSLQVVTPSRRRRRWAPLAAAAALAIVCGLFFVGQYRGANAVASVVSLDVNPSIQIDVNQKERVLSVLALNSEAEEVLADMDLQGTQLNVAVNAIVGSLLQHGYLSSLSSAILISVEDQDVQRADRIQTELTTEVDAALQNAAAGAAVLSQVVAQDAALESQAAASSISVGKAALIQQVQAANPQLDFDALAALSVEELSQMQRTGATAMPVGRAAAVAAAQAYAGLTERDIYEWEVDPELDKTPPYYEVELETAYGELEYDVDAYTGQVLKGRADVAKTGTPQTSSGGQSGGGDAQITRDEAMEIALKDAGISTGTAQGLRCVLDRDDGQSIYEVEFRSDGVEYEYEISAVDGDVLKMERDGEEWGSSSASDDGYIGQEAAKEAALAHAGVSASQVYDWECQLDRDDGRALYEIEFKAGGREYEYEIDAASGAVWKAESDYDD